MERRDGPGDLAVDRRIAHVLVRRVAVAPEELFDASIREVSETPRPPQVAACRFKRRPLQRPVDAEVLPSTVDADQDRDALVVDDAEHVVRAASHDPFDARRRAAPQLAHA